jgi:hypothetical protein
MKNKVTLLYVTSSAVSDKVINLLAPEFGI